MGAVAGFEPDLVIVQFGNLVIENKGSGRQTPPFIAQLPKLHNYQISPKVLGRHADIRNNRRRSRPPNVNPAGEK